MLASVRQIKTSNREFFFLVSFYETLISSPVNQSQKIPPRNPLQTEGGKKKKGFLYFHYQVENTMPI